MPASKQTRVEPEPEPELDEHGRPWDFFTNPSPQHVAFLDARVRQYEHELAAGTCVPYRQVFDELRRYHDRS